ncbi:peptide chain release factor N(5)-glutamine methyltransferase [Patescibacteria group bacterium]|nr:peptide chain release factor N(5)-glutamine methyltransferase [Patescibacteria group bacterium]
MTIAPETILAALNRGGAELKAAWIGQYFAVEQSPKLDAQVLMCAALGYTSAQLFSHGNEALVPEALVRFTDMLERRKKREPIAYILGQKEFYGRTFTVSKYTLIPRPETEIIIDEVKKILTCDDVVLDIGTGSGAIAITCASEGAEGVIATDVSKEALKIAKRNAEQLSVADKIMFLHGNLAAPIIQAWPHLFPKTAPQHLIVCANLPYLSKNQCDALDADVKFEPLNALLGGTDGLTLYKDLFSQLASAKNRLPQKITVLCEIDPSQKEKLTQAVREFFPKAEIGIVNDLAKHPRVLIATLR